jgi:hypothetical protein
MKKELLEKIFKSNKNIIVNGDVASGKTKCVMFPVVEELINKKESLMILDSKEEYVNQYYNKLKESNYNVVILNFRDLDKSEGWNPLEYPYELYKNGDKDKAVEYIEKIGKVLFYENSSQDPFWCMTASDFFTGVCLGLFEDAIKPSEINFNSVNVMFNGIEKKYGGEDYTTAYFKSKGVGSQAYTYASTTVLAPNETKASILCVARQKLKILVSRVQLSHLLNKTTFDINSIGSKPTAIIVIGRDENRTLNNLVTIFMEQLYAILVDKKVSVKFNFVLDNFDTIEKSNDLIDMLGSCLSRNMKFYISTRFIDEQVSVYGSYIKKLCDEISINDISINMDINSKQSSTLKTFNEIEMINSNIEFPKLSETSIELFNLEKKVNDIKNEQLSQGLDFKSLPELPNLPKSDLKVDDLIKQIDKRIEEIEVQEHLDNKKNDLI